MSQQNSRSLLGCLGDTLDNAVGGVTSALGHPVSDVKEGLGNTTKSVGGQKQTAENPLDFNH